MPIFDYTCSECGETKEYLLRNSDTIPDECSACGVSETGMKKEVSMPNGGFYGTPMSSNYAHSDSWFKQKS